MKLGDIWHEHWERPKRYHLWLIVFLLIAVLLGILLLILAERASARANISRLKTEGLKLDAEIVVLNTKMLDVRTREMVYLTDIRVAIETSINMRNILKRLESNGDFESRLNKTISPEVRRLLEPLKVSAASDDPAAQK